MRKKLLSSEVLLPAALAFISGALFLWLAKEVVIDKKDLFDTAAFNYFLQWRSPALTTLALLITRGGSDAFLIAVYLFPLYYLLKNKRNRQAIQLVIVVAASFLWNWLLKLHFHRPRPLPPHLDYVTSYSFPSGHTQGTFLLCSILIYITWKTKWSFIKKSGSTVALFLYACMIGMSRVYLHVHFLSDVMAGACVALCWLTFSIAVINLVQYPSVVSDHP